MQETKDLRHFAGWPLLPLDSGELHPLLPLERSPVLATDPDWLPELVGVLRKLGIRCAAYRNLCSPLLLIMSLLLS